MVLRNFLTVFVRVIVIQPAKLKLRQEIQKEMFVLRMHDLVGDGDKAERQSIEMSLSTENDYSNKIH